MKKAVIVPILLASGVAMAAGMVDTKSSSTPASGLTVVTVAASAKADRQAAKEAAKDAKAAAKEEKKAAREARRAARAARAAKKALAPLPPLDLSDMRLWNWKGIWHASEWNNTNSPLPWRYNHVAQRANRDTVFTIDPDGAPQLQPEGGMPSRGNGMWEADVTLPQMREGMIVAPLWLFDTASQDEVDFEFAGKKGLDVSMHVVTNGVRQTKTVRLFAGQDFSGRRVRFGIEVDQEDGSVTMYVDGKSVHTFDRDDMSFFISRPLKPWFEMWGATPKNSGFVQWAGYWNGLQKGESSVMTVHGYGYSTLD